MTKTKCVGGPLDGQEVEPHTSTIEMMVDGRRQIMYSFFDDVYQYDPAGKNFIARVRKEYYPEQSHD